MSTHVAPVVYLLFADDVLLYIGSTKRIEHRLSLHEKLTPWYGQVTHYETVPYPTIEDARTAETAAIQTEFPRWNIKDRSADHPDGAARFVWQVAAKYPLGLRAPMPGSDPALCYFQYVAPAAAGANLDDATVKAHCAWVGLRRYLEHMDAAGLRLSPNQAKTLARHREQSAAA